MWVRVLRVLDMTQPSPHQRTIIDNDDNDEEDADFQKALALSLQDHHHHHP